jgi:hypothetical protein
MYVCVRVRVCMQVYVHIFMYVYDVCTNACMHACMCVCVHAYAYIRLPGEKVLLGVDPLVYYHRPVLLERNKWRRGGVVGGGRRGRGAGHSLVSCRTIAGLLARYLPAVAREAMRGHRGHGQMRGGEAGGRGGGEGEPRCRQSVCASRPKWASQYYRAADYRLCRGHGGRGRCQRAAAVTQTERGRGWWPRPQRGIVDAPQRRRGRSDRVGISEGAETVYL